MPIERVGRVLLYILPVASALRRNKKTIVRHRTIVLLFRRVRTRKAAKFLVSGVENEQ